MGRIVAALLISMFALSGLAIAGTLGLTLLSYDKNLETHRIALQGGGERCFIDADADGTILGTNCLQLVNSKNINIVCTKNKKICKTYKEISNFTENAEHFGQMQEAEQIAILSKWNQAYETKDLSLFSKVFSDTIHYYGSDMGKRSVLADKKRFLQKHPDYTQEYSNVSTQSLGGGQYLVRFDKHIKMGKSSKTRMYPSYLLIGLNSNGKAVIVAESDRVSDRNIYKKIWSEGYYSVTAPELNIRNKPGSAGEVIRTVKKGEVHHFLAFVGKWGKSDLGWMSGKYLKLTSATGLDGSDTLFTEDAVQQSADMPTMDTPATYEVIAEELNLRDRPKKDGNILGTLKRGEKIVVYEFVEKWGRTEKGWISNKYLRYAAKDDIASTEEKENSRAEVETNESESTVQSDSPMEDKNNDGLAWYEILAFFVVIGVIGNILKKYGKTIKKIVIAIGFIILIPLSIAHPLLGVLAVVIFLGFIFKGCDGEKCPKCNTCVEHYSQKDIVEEHYKYETKDGKPDKRYKDNPIVTTYRYIYECTNESCKNRFEVYEEKEE